MVRRWLTCQPSMGTSNRAATTSSIAIFAVAQEFSDRPVKITVPGPLSIMDTTANRYYRSDRELAFDLAAALNFEIRALADAGCKYIQVDEPLFVRKVDDALDYRHRKPGTML